MMVGAAGGVMAAKGVKQRFAHTHFMKIIERVRNAIVNIKNHHHYHHHNHHHHHTTTTTTATATTTIYNDHLDATTESCRWELQ
jgi:hypothetical protein